MENKFLEIMIYSLPLSFDYTKEGSRENIIKKAKIYSSFKIDLLTLAVGPEFHDIILTSPKKPSEMLGNNIALSLKYNDKNKQKGNSLYTHQISPILNQKEKLTEYNYISNEFKNNPLIINTMNSMIDFLTHFRLFQG